MFFFFLFFSLTLTLFTTLSQENQASYISATVYQNINDGSYYIKPGVIDCTQGLACGYFNQTLNITGWSILEIKLHTPDQYSHTDNQIRMYAAGLLEGYLTAEQIYYNYYTIWQNEKNRWEPYWTELQNWTDIQNKWINEQISNNPNDTFWNYVDLLYHYQLVGLIDGYNNYSTYDVPALDPFVFIFLNAHEEFSDVIQSLDATLRVPWDDLTPSEAFELQSKLGHCSGLVKVTPTLDDIYFSHSTWSSFYRVNRIYKMYNFPLGNEYATTVTSFSAYPATLSSIDDWYLMDSGVASMETTNSIFNTTLYDYIIPQCLMVWERAMVANALAHTGKEWVYTFARYNSGTYNNQWIALTFSMFIPGEPLPDNLLWIAEQIPGNVSFLDVTDVLERGYWASYNVPAIEYIYQVTGQAAYASQKGTPFSYDLAPRARLFRNMANECNNITTVQKFMRYNDYENDPLEENNPTWAIMSRADLLPSNQNPSVSGGYDTKLSNLDMMKNLMVLAQSGPTHDQVPVFTWEPWSSKYCHVGLPEAYNFDWVIIKPQL